MALQDKDDAKIDTQTNLDALIAEANALFLIEAEKLIEECVVRGEFKVYMTTGIHVDVSTVSAALVALDYSVTFPNDDLNTEQFRQAFGTNIVAGDLVSPARLCVHWD